MSNNIKLFTSRVFLILLSFLFSTLLTFSQSKMSVFRDSTDNAIDISNWLLQKKGFLPVPMVITEPALGFGAAAAIMFFHSSYMESEGPPSVSGLFGGGTDNGTWGLGGFHAGFWKDDNIRYLGALFKVDVNIKYYGPGLILDDGIKMNMDSWFLLQQLKFRIASSDFFIGGKYIYVNTDNVFDLPIDIPGFNGIHVDNNLSELSLLLDYDIRNNVFTPTKGMFAYLNTTYSDTWLGGEALYGRLEAGFIGFMPMSKVLNLGIRYDSRHAFGDTPFWAKPFADMRGVPLMKYQNNHVQLFEAEFTANVYKRWYLKAFTGMANAYENIELFSKGKSVRNVGTGFRYQLARLLGLRMGMDFAWSNDDFGFYIVAGHAWMR